MRLADLCRELWLAELIGTGDVEIRGFAMDSRLVQPGDLFVALHEPEMADRHEFVSAAVEAGAAAVLVDRPVAVAVPQLRVPDVAVAAGLLADAFYGRPSWQLRVVGVTGTKGKTTTAYLAHHALVKQGRPYGLLGTIAIRYGAVDRPSTNTTLHGIEWHKTLAQMQAAGMQGVVAEISSHALRLRRLAGTRLVGGAFTNLGQDHLNFHRDQADYAHAKSLLFSHLGLGGGGTRVYAVINAEAESSDLMRASASCETLKYGRSAQAQLRAAQVETGLRGTRLRLETPWGATWLETSLIGDYNVENLLAAAGIALGEGLSPAGFAAAIADFPGVPGRLERVDDGRHPFTVVVDYAHTANSLQAVLKALRALEPRRVITLFGCGGDRDRSKRPVMAQVATALSDLTILTSDNPRTEDPEAILDEIERGVTPQANYRRIADRRQAIAAAIEAAGPGDVVLIAGKGHEDYQIIGHTKYPFDDRVEARRVLGQRGPSETQKP